MEKIFLIRKESYRSGAKRTLKVPVIAAGAIKQYAKDDNTLPIGYLVETFDYLNFFTCINNGAVDIEVQLDFLDSKTYPCPKGATVGVDEIQFNELNVKNLDGAASTVLGKIILVVGYEPPQMREREKLTEMFSKKDWKVRN